MLRPAFIAFCACWMMLSSAPVAHGADAGATQTVLAKYGDDLAAAWENYSKDTQKTVRDQHITDLNTQFSKDIIVCNAPQNFTLEKAINAYMDNLKRAPILLKLAEKMQSERNLYTNACATALKREAPLTTDYKANRTTQQVFELMLDKFAAVRDNLRGVPPEVKTGAIQSLNSIFSELIRSASIPEKPDATEQLDVNITEARRRFPINSPDIKLTNGPIFTLLETAARQIQQRAIKK